MKPNSIGSDRRPTNMIGAGLAIGAGVGVALDNIGAGIAIGLAIGVALSRRHKRKNNDADQNDSGAGNSNAGE